MTTDVWTRTAAELHAGFRDGELSPVEACTESLERIAEVDPSLNAFCLVDADRALDQARASEGRYARGDWLSEIDGVPVAVKDLLLTEGWPTLRGSLSIDPSGPWLDDAPVVARLRGAGAVMVGKTTTPEFGCKGVTDSPRHGVTRNPWNPALTPGGSSGGSAAALMAGMVPLALGTDGGGSIRIPGALTGVTGMKATFGQVPVWPASPFGTLSHAGPMARTVADARVMLSVLAQPDARDWSALPALALKPASDVNLDSLRIGFAPSLTGDHVAPEVALIVANAVETFVAAGARVETIDAPVGTGREIFDPLWQSGAAVLVGQIEPSARADLDPTLVELAEAGERLSGVEIARAAQRRGEYAEALSTLFTEIDVLLTPTIPIVAFAAGRDAPEDWRDNQWQSWTPFTIPLNLSQQPAATVPCGLTGDGLPVGLQVIGAKYRDPLVLDVAEAYERSRCATEAGNDPFVRPLIEIKS